MISDFTEIFQCPILTTSQHQFRYWLGTEQDVNIIAPYWVFRHQQMDVKGVCAFVSPMYFIVPWNTGKNVKHIYVRVCITLGHSLCRSNGLCHSNGCICPGERDNSCFCLKKHTVIAEDRRRCIRWARYSDITMSAMASQITDCLLSRLFRRR